MIEFIPYEPHHLEEVNLQFAQEQYRDLFVKPGYAKSLYAPGKSWTGIMDGRIVGCAGLQEQWEGRSIAWAVFGHDIPKTLWPHIVRHIQKTLDAEIEHQKETIGRSRIEIDVTYGFGAGCRLASILGFQVEGMRRKFTPDGADCFMYARVA